MSEHPPGEIAATVTRLRRLCDRLERARGVGVRLNASEAVEVAAVLRREIDGMVGGSGNDGPAAPVGAAVDDV
jgi:hypothetical protein